MDISKIEKYLEAKQAIRGGVPMTQFVIEETVLEVFITENDLSSMLAFTLGKEFARYSSISENDEKHGVGDLIRWTFAFLIGLYAAACEDERNHNYEDVAERAYINKLRELGLHQ